VYKLSHAVKSWLSKNQTRNINKDESLKNDTIEDLDSRKPGTWAIGPFTDWTHGVSGGREKRMAVMRGVKRKGELNRKGDWSQRRSEGHIMRGVQGSKFSTDLFYLILKRLNILILNPWGPSLSCPKVVLKIVSLLGSVH